MSVDHAPSPALVARAQDDPAPSALTRLVARLTLRAPLSEDDVAAIRQLSCRLRSSPIGDTLVHEGEPPDRCAFILSGYAYRQKLTRCGDREIVAVLLPGDLIDLQNVFFAESDHDVVALTGLSLAELDLAELRALALARPGVARALWIDGQVEASIAREWLLNLGRRDARTRLAHLLCEFHARLRFGGIETNERYELPMTQEQFGDTLGLTPVHINRMFQQLERDGLITRERRMMRVLDWEALKKTGQFNERYLHMRIVRV